MTQPPIPNEEELKPTMQAIIEAWIHNDKAQVGPKRILEGNNFDMLAEDLARFVATHTAQAYQRGRIDEAKVCEKARRHDPKEPKQ